MDALNTIRINCPYCGETFETLLDSSEAGSSYIEDCYVCCRPIRFSVHEAMTGELNVMTEREYDC